MTELAVVLTFTCDDTSGRIAAIKVHDSWISCVKRSLCHSNVTTHISSGTGVDSLWIILRNTLAQHEYGMRHNSTVFILTVFIFNLLLFYFIIHTVKDKQPSQHKETMTLMYRRLLPVSHSLVLFINNCSTMAC